MISFLKKALTLVPILRKNFKERGRTGACQSCRNVGFNISEVKYRLDPAHQLLHYIPKGYLLLPQHSLLHIPQCHFLCILESDFQAMNSLLRFLLTAL